MSLPLVVGRAGRSIFLLPLRLPLRRSLAGAPGPPPTACGVLGHPPVWGLGAQTSPSVFTGPLVNAGGGNSASPSLSTWPQSEAWSAQKCIRPARPSARVSAETPPGRLKLGSEPGGTRTNLAKTFLFPAGSSFASALLRILNLHTSTHTRYADKCAAGKPSKQDF